MLVGQFLLPGDGRKTMLPYRGRCRELVPLPKGMDNSRHGLRVEPDGTVYFVLMLTERFQTMADRPQVMIDGLSHEVLQRRGHVLVVCNHYREDMAPELWSMGCAPDFWKPSKP